MSPEDDTEAISALTGSLRKVKLDDQCDTATKNSALNIHRKGKSNGKTKQGLGKLGSKSNTRSTNFFRLPRELRQKPLVRSFRDIDYGDDDKKAQWGSNKLMKWAIFLRGVDEQLVEDINFAEKKESLALSKWVDAYEKKFGRARFEDDWDFNEDDFLEVYGGIEGVDEVIGAYEDEATHPKCSVEGCSWVCLC